MQICAVRHGPDGLFAPSHRIVVQYTVLYTRQTSPRRLPDVWETSGRRCGRRLGVPQSNNQYKGPFETPHPPPCTAGLLTPLREARKGPFADQTTFELGGVAVSRDDFARVQWDVESWPPTVSFKTAIRQYNASTTAARSSVTVAEMELPRTKAELIAAVSAVLSLIPAGIVARGGQRPAAAPRMHTRMHT